MHLGEETEVEDRLSFGWSLPEVKSEEKRKLVYEARLLRRNLKERMLRTSGSMSVAQENVEINRMQEISRDVA